MTTVPSTLILPDVDLAFSDRLKLRENALAWISRDFGLQPFFFPSNNSLTHDLQKQNDYTIAAVQNYLTGTAEGEGAFKRSILRENAANLRRFITNLRRNTVTHRDVARCCLLLELFWDKMNDTLSDSNWARCSLHFDTALISLRIVYLSVHLHEEYPSDAHPTSVRAAAFATLVNSLFSIGAPMDAEETDKHSTNFKDLLSAWREEFLTYISSNEFEDKVARLETVQGKKEAADLLDAFLREMKVDDNWMLLANQLVDDMENGRIARRTGRKRRRKDAPRSPVEEIPELEPSDEAEGEAEPKINDEDFDPDDADNDDDEDEDDSDNSLSPVRTYTRRHREKLVRRSPRGLSSIRNRRLVRRSSRLKESGEHFYSEAGDYSDTLDEPPVPKRKRGRPPLSKRRPGRPRRSDNNLIHRPRNISRGRGAYRGTKVREAYNSKRLVRERGLMEAVTEEANGPDSTEETP